MTKRTAEWTAYHEAGHAVAAYALRLSLPKWVTIVPKDHAAGMCQNDGVFSQRPEVLRAMLATRRPGMTRAAARAALRASTERHVVAELAGLAAEGRRRHFSRLLAGYVLFRDVAAVADDDVAQADEQLAVFERGREAREAWLSGLWDRAWKLTGASWRDVERVAKALLRRKRLDGDALDRLLLPPVDPKELRRVQRAIKASKRRARP